MAGISTGGGHGGKKSVDHEIPLIPFIDLLLCCVMFLLATAVWSQLARNNANQKTPGQAQPDDQPPPEEKVKLILQVQKQGYVLASSAGDRTDIPKNGDTYNLEDLRNKLRARHEIEPNRTDLVVAPDDDVRYDDVIAAMDVAVGEKYPDVSLSEGGGL